MEASPRDRFNGKIRKISSQGSIWQKRKQAPQGTGLAKNWTEMLPRFAQSRREAKSCLKLESHPYTGGSPNDEVCT